MVYVVKRHQEGEVLLRGHGMQDSIFRPLRSRMIHLQMAHETSQVLLQLKEPFHAENIRPTQRTKFWRLFLSFSSFSPEAIHCDGKGGKGGIHYIRLNQLTWDGGTGKEPAEIERKREWIPSENDPTTER